MGDIKRLGSGFSISAASPIFRSSLSLPKVEMGAIHLPEVSKTQVLNQMTPKTAAVDQALFDSFYNLEQTQSNAAMTLKTRDGRSIPASKYLAPDELKQLARLPNYYQIKILNVSAAKGSSQIQNQLRANIKSVIQDLSKGANIQFSEQNQRQWSVRNLLDLTNAIQQLPLAHRKQLDGVNFVRDSEPAFGYKDHAPDLMEKMANKMVAGHYDLKSRSVILYDRGVQDSFPNLDSEMEQSMRALSNCSCNNCEPQQLDPELQKSLRSASPQAKPTEIRNLQSMLNPYLIGRGRPSISEDGVWSAQTEQGIRTVQAQLLEKYLNANVPLSLAQKQELQQLQDLAASPQFGMITRVVNLKDRMKNLDKISEPHVQKLLQELAKSQFGEASLQFLLRDVSDAFRANPQVSRTEEVMIHEMGHHLQLGLSNENEYIAEFGKLSSWVERATGEAADGYIQGSSTSEDMVDVYNQLASGTRLDEGHYGLKLTPQERSQVFVTEYASTDPMEDFAESYKTYVLNPVQLMESSPEKFFFINALPTIQSRKMGSGAQEKTHYQNSAVIEYARAALRNQYRTNPTQAQVDGFIRQHFENMIGTGASPRPLNLSAETVLAIVDTHQDLLKAVNMPYISTEKIRGKGDADYTVLRQIHEQTLNLIKSHGSDKEAKDFFYGFTNPNEIERRFPKASATMRENLKDPAFASMMLALGKIGGYASVINQGKSIDMQDQQSYQDAKDYFSTALKQPSALLSKQALTQSYNLLRGLSSEMVNPEDRKIAPALQFFRTLEADPAAAFPEGWYQFPDEFKDMLRNQRFIQSISGDGGRYLPSAEVTRETLQKLMEMVEFQRGIEMLRNG